MNTSLLLTILLCSLVAGLISFIVLLPRKKDDNRFQKISAIATILTSMTTTVVGIATISIASGDALRDKLQRQPLYSVKYEMNYSEEKSVFDNQEYVITNEGEKTKSKTDVSHFGFLVLTYSDSSGSPVTITKYCPLNGYFGANFITSNLDGVVQYSRYSQNNNECFFRLYQSALLYGQSHPGVSLLVEKEHYFVLDYTDIFGEKHQVVKRDDIEIDPQVLSEVRKKAEKDANGKSFNALNLNLEEIVEICFPEISF